MVPAAAAARWWRWQWRWRWQQVGGATILWARGKGQKERARLRENPEGAGIPENEFSRPFSSEVLGKGKSMTLEAKPAELAALSKRFGVQEIPALEATVSTQQRKGLRHCVFLEGRISGEVVQACAISGSSVPSTIEVDFECMLLEEGAPTRRRWPRRGLRRGGARGREGGLGEIIAQYFALEIDTYPTAPDDAPRHRRRRMANRSVAGGGGLALSVVQNATGWEDGRAQTQKSIARSLLRLRPKRFLRSRRSSRRSLY